MRHHTAVGRIRALVLALMVPVGAVCAPFLHAHVDDDHDGHHSTEVHAHLSSHARSQEAHDGIAFEEADHGAALYLQVFVAVEVTPFDIPDIAVASFALTAPVERAARRPIVVAHGHDPPFADALDSRPPPLAFLS